MSTVAADFDRLALLDEQGWTANNHYHKLLLNKVPANCEHALEIGCGTGAFARLLAQRCKKVIALDLSPGMIHAAKSRSNDFNNIEFQQADVMSWEFPRSHFEFICSIATLHHLDQRELLARMKESLRPGGVLLVLDLVESSSWFEGILDAFAILNSGALRLLHNGQMRQPAPVRKAWEEHGKHDHYLSMKEIRALAGELFPFVTVRRCLLWRYLLVYHS
jgi:ubiquinone/menaquinone biosynthesis C-methylase UbiE